jgi:hypothetical protein
MRLIVDLDEEDRLGQGISSPLRSMQLKNQKQ